MHEVSDLSLIEDIKKNNSSDSLSALAERHAGIFLKIAKRFTGGTASVKFPLEDVLEQREAIVYEAVKDFDPSRGFKFATWLGSKLKFYCLNSFKSRTRYVPVDPHTIEFIVDSHYPSERPERDRKDLEIAYILSVLNQTQDPRIRKIINWRYFSENKKHTKFAHIANRLGMSTQGVIDLHNKFIDFMRRKIAATENMDKI